MSNTNAATTAWNSPNYIGTLYRVGQNQTPFLNMLGGLQGGNERIVRTLQFAIAQPWSLNSASQPAITETTSLAAPTAWTYVRGQDVNTCQIFQTQVSISYVAMAESGKVYADTTTKTLDITDTAPVTNERDFQIAAHMEQIAFDVDYTFLNGAYQQATAANVAAKNRGIITAATTNTVAAGAASLSKSLINQLLRTMAGNGSRFRQPVLFCNAFQVQKISDIYGYAPMSTTVGGVAVSEVITDFCRLSVVYAPNVPAATVLVADMAVVRPVFCEVPGKGVLFYEPLSKAGASESGQLFGLIGLDYGPEEFHGTITGLATS